MNTLEDQLAAYGVQRREDQTPITADDVMPRPVLLVGDASDTLIPKDSSSLRVRGPLTGVIFAVVVIVLFALFAVAATMVGDDPASVEPPTSTTMLTDASPGAVADGFMEAWVARDGEAAAALLTPMAVVDRFDHGDLLPPLHDWYRAVGMEFHAEGCVAGPTTDFFQELYGEPLQHFECVYSESSKVTRALGLPVSMASLKLGISSHGIERLDLSPFAVVLPKPDYLSGENLDDMFMEWILVNHPDDFETMFRDETVAITFGSPEGLILWGRYTDEFTAAPDHGAEVLADWQAEADERAAYLAEARVICQTSPTYGWNQDATRLRALPPPPDTLNGVMRYFYSVAAQLADGEQKMMAAAGDDDLLRDLTLKQILLVHTYDLLIPGCARGGS